MAKLSLFFIEQDTKVDIYEMTQTVVCIPNGTDVQKRPEGLKFHFPS